MSSFWSCGLQVRVADGPNKGRTYPLDAPEMTIGRAKSGGDRAPGWILLFDETVSRIQADLKWDEDYDAYVLINRSETNPTRVNEAVVTTNLILKVGDQIRVGHSVLDLQGADFRFGGMKPPVARTRPATGALPGQPNLQFVNPLNDGEKPVNTKKAPRIVALTTRPKLQFTAVHGTHQGQSWPISGMALAVGGSAPVESQEPPLPAAVEGEEPLFVTKKIEEKFWDQEIQLEDGKIPQRGFLLTWRELEGAFEMTRRCGFSVTLERRTDGTEWIAELPSDGAVTIRTNDIIWLADTALHLNVPQEEGS